MEKKFNDTYEEDDDVCCVGCGERVCSFTEEPPHKDRKDEAVCDSCWGMCEESGPPKGISIMTPTAGWSLGPCIVMN